MPEILDVAVRKLRQDKYGASERSVSVNISNAAEKLDDVKPGTHAKVGVRSDGAVIVRPVSVDEMVADGGEPDE